MYIYIYKGREFGLVWFYGIWTIEGYLMPNSLYTCILNIYDLVLFCFMAYQPLWVISCQILFIHIYQIYKIGFDGISTLVGYLMPNPLYIYTYIYIYIY